MNAEIIAVGDEVVKGYTINTNASYIAKQLQTIGIMPDYHTAVRDQAAAIKAAINTAIVRSKYIIVTGGLGPTKDDLTKEAVCEALGLPLCIRVNVLEEIKAYFKEMNQIMPSINEKQAAFPEEAYILKNNYGTAPGCIIEYNEAIIILLPGPPYEMQPMLENEVIPYLKQKRAFYNETLDIKLFGLGESEVATQLQGMLGEFEWGSIATYVGEYEIIVRINVQSGSLEKAKEQLQQKKKEVEERLGSFIIGYNKDRLEEIIVRFLLKNKKTIATVESCTGGLLAGTLINCGGVSACFNEGIVTYSNTAKMKYVDVKEATLQSVGAVSYQTAREMAEGVRKCSGADIGLSTTGIAGPDGGTPEKPVGLVYIGIATEAKTDVYELHLKGSRRTIREKTVKNILFQLYKLFK